MLAGAVLVAAACAAAPGVRTEQAAQPTHRDECDRRPRRRRSSGRRARMHRRADDGVGVRVGRRPARPRRPGGRHDRRRPQPARSSTTATPAARSSSTPAARARRASSSPGTSSTCCRPTCSTHYYPVGWDPRGVGRSLPAIDCGDVDATGMPERRDVHRADRAAARPGRCGRRRRSTSKRSAPPSGSNASTTSATATARRSARCTPWPTPTASGSSCSTGRSIPTRAIPTARSPPTACRTTPPTRPTTSIARFHELCDASTECAAGPDSRRSSTTSAATIRDLPTAELRRAIRRR